MEAVTDMRSRRPSPASVRQRVQEADHDEVGVLVEPRALAALAVGLAFAGVDPPAAVSELAASGGPTLLTEAREHLDDLVTHVPGARDHARRLLEAAVIAPGGAALSVRFGPGQDGPSELAAG